MAVGIPSGLGALLGMLGRLGQASAEAKAAAQPPKSEDEKPELIKGTLLGEDGALLAGLGYNSADRQTDQRNITEQGAVARFLHDLEEKSPAAAPPGESLNTGPQTEREAAREERPEEFKTPSQASTEEKKERRTESETEPQREREDRQDREDEDAHGQGWVAEEAEREETPPPRGLREADALGESARCRGQLEDGSRCLRRPIRGAPYCPEHAARWQPPRGPTRG